MRSSRAAFFIAVNLQNSTALAGFQCGAILQPQRFFDERDG